MRAGFFHHGRTGRRTQPASVFFSRRAPAGRRFRHASLEQLEDRRPLAATTLTPAADGFANDLDLDGRFDSLDTTSDSMYIRLYPPSAGIGEDRGLLEFDLAALSPASRVTSARLNICPKKIWVGSAASLDVYGYVGDGTLTTEDAVRQAARIGSVSISALNTYSISLDTSFFQSLVGAGRYAGLFLRVSSGTGVTIHSSEATSVFPNKRPNLVLDTQSLVSDFGDAPGPYPTAAGGGLAPAQHEIRAGFWLGAGVDSEADGQPDVAASGDDAHGSSDEDGVVFSSPLVRGSVAAVDVTASAAGKLDAWIDFNGDGDWADPGEQIFASQSLAAGVNHLAFAVPASAAATARTYARFRFSSAGGLDYYGLAADGEVEDYGVGITEPLQDFGDAPDSPYPTLLASNGASHGIAGGLYLGAGVDAETDGQPNADASGDDAAGTAGDEDGVAFTSLLVPGETATIEVSSSAAGKLDAWIDFDADGSWLQTGDRIFESRPLAPGVNTLTFMVPAAAAASGKTFARFRVSSAGGLSCTGPAGDGEVEDYQVVVQPPVFSGGAQDDDFTFSTDGVTHTVTMALKPQADVVTRTFDASIIRLIRFDGMGGQDRIRVAGGPGDETATLAETSGTVAAPGYSVMITSVEQISIDAGPGGNQSATIEDGLGDDSFYGAYDAGTSGLRGSMYYDHAGAISVWGFATIDAKALRGGSDQAILVDGPGDDTFTGQLMDGRLQYAAGGTIRVSGFRQVSANAISTAADANDQAILYDSQPADQMDRFVSTPELAYLNYGDGSGGAGQNFTLGFNRVEARSHGGADWAQLFGRDGVKDLFFADGLRGWSRLQDAADTYSSTIEGFKTIYAHGSPGTAGIEDEATLLGTPEGELFVSLPRNLSYLVGPSGMSLAWSFGKVTAVGGGGSDTAHVFDADDEDLLTATEAAVKLEAVTGPAYTDEAQDFTSVYVHSPGGGEDLGRLSDSPWDDLFYAGPHEGYLSLGTGKFYTWEGFDGISAEAGQGNDVVYLVDYAVRPAADTLYAAKGLARMEGPSGSYSNQATGFDQLFAYASEGDDLAAFEASELSDSLAILPGVSSINYGASAGSAGLSVAVGFDRVDAHSAPHDSMTHDSAYLYGTAEPDVVQFDQFGASISTSGKTYGTVTGFQETHALFYGGSGDKAYFKDSGTDNNYFLGELNRSYMYYPATLNWAEGAEEVEVAFLGGDETVVLNGSPYLEDRLRSPATDELLLDDAMAACYSIRLHGLARNPSTGVKDAVEAHLQDKGQDASSIDLATVDYLFTLDQPGAP